MTCLAGPQRGARDHSTSEALRQRTTLIPSGRLRLVATKTISWKNWLAGVLRAAGGDGLDDRIGVPIADVCRRLDISKQRVGQLVEADRLDAIHVTTSKGTTAIVLITEASLARYHPNPSGVGFNQKALT